MTYLIKLGIKNIMRSKRRSVLTFLVLSFGVGIYIFFVCLMVGFDQVSVKNVIDFETGHYKIRSNTFDEERPYETVNYISQPDAVVEKLKTLPFITGIAQRVQFLAELDNGLDALGVVAVGIGQDDQQVFDLNKYIIEGRLEAKGALIGKQLSDDLGLAVGDMTYLTFRTKQGMITSVEILITGLIHSTNPQVNAGTVFINKQEAHQLLNTNDVSEITIKTNAFFKVVEFEPQIIQVLSDEHVAVYSWEKLSEDFRAMMAMKRKFQNVLVLMIMVIAIVGIVNTMLMSVYEKKREIGTMKALGFTDKEVKNLFLIEGAFIGIAGGIAGLILGTLFNLYFATKGMDLNSMFGDATFGLPVMGTIKSSWEISAYINAMIFTLIASLLASYYPAKKVTRMEAMECLRTVQ